MEFNRNVLLPNVLTIGNGVCGFLALIHLTKVQVAPEDGPLAFAPIGSLATAAWLVFLGMVFDVFDGKVARYAGGSSALGAMLDSLCDLVTFGVVPAFMIVQVNRGLGYPGWQRVVLFFSLVYFLGATLRLARFTAENSDEGSAHLAFKGLPTPGAAGCIASLVLFYTYIVEFRQPELHWVARFVAEESLRDLVSFILPALPVLGLLLGFIMVSNKLVFDHAGSWLLSRKHSFDFFAYVIFGAVLAAVVPELVLPVVFLGYLVYQPVMLVWRALFPPRAPQLADPSALPGGGDEERPD